MIGLSAKTGSRISWAKLLAKLQLRQMCSRRVGARHGESRRGRARSGSHLRKWQSPAWRQRLKTNGQDSVACSIQPVTLQERALCGVGKMLRLLLLVTDTE